MNNKQVVLSGIRATGKLHLGNYFGALRYFAKLANDPRYECNFFIANLHTITTRINPEEIKKDLLNIVIDFISIGIDPSESTIFAQSSIPETCELTWIFNCITTIPELERLPHYKEKKDKTELKEGTNAGLLIYPVLMAADILGPKANLVPVGEDQHPHVELAREIARRFNAIYGETFPIPELLEGEAVRVPGLDGTGKMGKSDQNTIDLDDTPEMVSQKVSRAVTDVSRVRRTDAGDPNKCNIYSYHQLLSNSEELTQVYNGCITAGIGCIDCKNIVIKHINDLLAPIQERKRELIKKGPGFPLEILHEGGKRARVKISETVNTVKEKVGVILY